MSRCERYPLNKGDFYVSNGECIACGAPQTEAPEIIEHRKEDGHCYFTRQPETEAEQDQVILAMRISCIDALRYGGTDEKILKRLYENGMSDLCDHAPARYYPTVAKNNVTFVFKGRMPELVKDLTSYLQGLPAKTIVSREATRQGQIRLVQRWQEVALAFYYAIRQEGEMMLITVSRGPNVQEPCLGVILHGFLQRDLRVSDIKWWAQSPGDGEYYVKPY
ncbi:MAG TPA: ferredoxin [Puia sp.]